MQRRYTEGSRVEKALLKLSGQSVAGPGGKGIDMEAAWKVASDIKPALSRQADTTIVMGGGGIIRGAIASPEVGPGRIARDRIGMLGTLLGGMALKEGFRENGVEAVVMSTFAIDPNYAEQYTYDRAMRHLANHKVVIVTGGLNQPLFSTDTISAQLAIELGCSALYVAKRGTKLRGIHSADPETDVDAEYLDHVTHQDVLDRKLKVLDGSAVSMCRDHNMPIIVFPMRNLNLALAQNFSGRRVGSLVTVEL